MNTDAGTCGSCNAGYTCQGASCVPLPPAADVTVTFPYLFDQNGSKVLATYISHVITSSRYPLTEITLANTGGPAALQVSVDLPTYGSPSIQMVSLAADETKTIKLSPVINYATLFQNTTTLPAAIGINVTAGGTSIYGQTFPIEISGRNTVFFRNGSTNTMPLVSTMVTPYDVGGYVDNWVRGAANRFPTGQMVGYQLPAWPAGSYTMAPGYYSNESFYVLQGETPQVVIDTVTGGVDDNFAVFIMDDANFNAWTNGQSASACAIDTTTTNGTVLGCTGVAEGWFHIVYFNPNDNFANRTASRRRPMMKWEVTYYQSKALFEELRARGLKYVNLTGGSSFFSSTQNVRYPAQSIVGMGANCIDGALLFSSAFEALGMEPVVALSFTAGHAFAVVRCWAGSTTCFVPIETTLVGDTSRDFWGAFSDGWQHLGAWANGGHLQMIDIKAAREAGLTPAPM